MHETLLIDVQRSTFNAHRLCFSCGCDSSPTFTRSMVNDTSRRTIELSTHHGRPRLRKSLTEQRSSTLSSRVEPVRSTPRTSNSSVILNDCVRPLPLLQAGCHFAMKPASIPNLVPHPHLRVMGDRPDKLFHPRPPPSAHLLAFPLLAAVARMADVAVQLHRTKSHPGIGIVLEEIWIDWLLKLEEYERPWAM